MINDSHYYWLTGLLGVLVHTLLKYQSLSRDAQRANASLSINQFLQNDWLGILLAAIAVPVWLLLMPEALKKYPALTDYLRFSFFVVGMMGSYLLQLVNSRSKKELMKIIDKKTDIADGKTKDTEIN